MQESSMNPAEGGGGLAQWGGSRYTALQKYASNHGLDPNGYEAQIGYLWQELSSGTEGLTPDDLNNMTAAQAAQAFSDKFERPNSALANNSGRQSYANQYLAQFNGGR